ncbi:unnamed protein product, partial [Allacma fusca]
EIAVPIPTLTEESDSKIFSVSDVTSSIMDATSDSDLQS